VAGDVEADVHSASRTPVFMRKPDAAPATGIAAAFSGGAQSRGHRDWAALCGIRTHSHCWDVNGHVGYYPKVELANHWQLPIPLGDTPPESRRTLIILTTGEACSAVSSDLARNHPETPMSNQPCRGDEVAIPDSAAIDALSVASKAHRIFLPLSGSAGVRKVRSADERTSGALCGQSTGAERFGPRSLLW
jgi:hypothetical protein